MDTLQALGQTAEWFRRALAVEPVRGKLRLSGYSACGQDGGVPLPREYIEGFLFLHLAVSHQDVLQYMCLLYSG